MEKAGRNIPIRLLLMDGDGTSIPNTPNGMPSRRVIDRVRGVILAGKHVSLVTGRPYHKASPIASALELVDPYITDGGANIRNPITGEILYEKQLSVKKIQTVLDLCLPFGYDILSSDEHNPLLNTVDRVREKTPELCIANIKGEDSAKILETLKQINNLAAHLVPGREQGLHDIHITDINATKFHAVRRLQKILGVKPDETMAIGDGNNDIPLLRRARIKVAMGNASQELKQEANYITGTVENDGVAEAIDVFILNPR